MNPPQPGSSEDGWDWLGVVASGVGAPRDEVRFADLNGDGRDDHLAINDDGAATAWTNNGQVREG
ncbi:hypothetical protein [Parafrankia sp. FMc2]|uniref:hypothetical protein n=1 Tax=Parafrankia sp. FMc2 TaxID=3233196 RepID=UPI0034D3C779